jgi:hypothetical protein
MKLFFGMCGRLPDGFESSGRGESRWAQSLVRCFMEAGHEITMAPDTELAEWGTCPKPRNVRLLQGHEKRFLHAEHFDVAIFSSWQDFGPEARYINADKYLWGVMGWKTDLMRDGYFKDNEYVIRLVRADVDCIPYPINFKDRCFLLAQPIGKECEPSRFSNKRIGWTAKEAFLDTTNLTFSVAAARHIFAIVDACKVTGASLSIFSCHELDPKLNPRIVQMGVDKKLAELGDRVTFYPNLPFKEYQKELRRCSLTVPVSFAGSIQESILAGVVPFMYKDSMFSNHPWIAGVCSDMTLGRVSRAQSPEDEKDLLAHDELVGLLSRFMEDQCYFENFLYRMRPMVIDNLDSHVLDQFNQIMKHQVKSDNVRS